MKDKGFKAVMALAVLGLMWAHGGMVDRFVHGHIAMGFGSYVPWGLWVVFYLFFVGLTAGAFLITIITTSSRWSGSRASGGYPPLPC